MTPDDDVTSDGPVELDAVAADDALVERLRGALSPDDAVVWDDDDVDDDLSYALLRALQRDVSMETAATHAEVVPLVPRGRRIGRTATVAAVAATVLSIAGAAAASSSPGSPLYGVRSAVASAVHGAVAAVTPSKPDESSAAGPAVAATPTATISPRGTAVSTAARSASAVVQIEERIATAQRLLDAGRPVPAGEVLDQAERRLPLVTDLTRRADLQRQIDALRARAAAMSQPHGKPSTAPSPAHGKSESHRPTTPGRSADHRSETPAAQPSHPATPNRKPSLPNRVLPAPAASAQNR